MTKLKIIVSPFYSEESYEDKTTGFVFHKTDSPYVISLNDERLKGVKEGLRKNFLIPYDKETLDFITANDLPSTVQEETVAPVAAARLATEQVEEEPVQVVEEESAAVQEEAAAATKKTRKRTTKKAEEAKAAE